MPDTFVCARCETVLTAPLDRVALPVHAHRTWGNAFAGLPVLLEPGSYAVDPEPSGPPWRRWEEVGEAAAEARGVYAPLAALSYGAAGAVVIAPGDGRGMELRPDRCDGGCCGTDRRSGPNLACTGCGELVACRVDDCDRWQGVWLEPAAVLRRSIGDDRPDQGWESIATGPATPPTDREGHWQPEWQFAAGAALAHLLAACDGAPVRLPPGGATTVFSDGLARLLPAAHAERPARVLTLAGPGLHSPDPDIALVPRHPVTAEPWAPPNGAPTVPLDASLWAHLAHPATELEVRPSGHLPPGLLRDEPPRRPPRYPFRADPVTLRQTLARLPAVRRPWLRELYDALPAYWW
ncbi:hypothetical protein ACIRBX_18965 [Kitasatospora sp. NPDC096147]|uniref:hypothetical protein n=1 Tax=Kitasatospora sp. NPDC096147 TaxID=3364093 RepID=UPI003826134E